MQFKQIIHDACNSEFINIHPQRWSQKKIVGGVQNSWQEFSAILQSANEGAFVIVFILKLSTLFYWVFEQLL